ncbi:hypothetical protein [Rhizobium leguminosarum]|uniref:hypothetical protein n=1 Tax=Rhizobium leguminosarum TaxID=384 RepID=UPI0024A881B6|nr:hypothetical protein [Rhizobium leguminosarum]MDI5929014.1 hypothetical protein [Rhizobium leguminosarum]
MRSNRVGCARVFKALQDYPSPQPVLRHFCVTMQTKPCLSDWQTNITSRSTKCAKVVIDPEKPVNFVVHTNATLRGISFVVTSSETKSGATLKICFPDQARQSLYNCRGNLVRLVGEEIARRVCCRLAALQAAQTLAEVPSSPPLRCVPSSSPGIYTLDVGKTHQLQLRAVGLVTSTRIDPSAVKEVEILDIILNPARRGKHQ